MRCTDDRADQLCSCADFGLRLQADGPLRPIRKIIDEALDVLSMDFEVLHQ